MEDTLLLNKLEAVNNMIELKAIIDELRFDILKKSVSSQRRKALSFVKAACKKQKYRPVLNSSCKFKDGWYTTDSYFLIKSNEALLAEFDSSKGETYPNVERIINVTGEVYDFNSTLGKLNYNELDLTIKQNRNADEYKGFEVNFGENKTNFYPQYLKLVFDFFEVGKDTSNLKVTYCGMYKPLKIEDTITGEAMIILPYRKF